MAPIGGDSLSLGAWLFTTQSFVIENGFDEVVDELDEEEDDDDEEKDDEEDEDDEDEVDGVGRLIPASSPLLDKNLEMVCDDSCCGGGGGNDLHLSLWISKIKKYFLNNIAKYHSATRKKKH